MSIVSILSCFVFLFLVTVDYGTLIQRNLHFIERIGDDESDVITQHDCLPVDHWENKANIYEITLYCMSEWSSKWNIQENHVDQRFSFAQLHALDITSEQLYFWSAPLDLVEDYQSYLNQMSESNQSSMSTYWFYNCTPPTFGPKCQYSFDEDEPSQLSLKNIIYDSYLRNETSQMNRSCYIHLECNTGSSLLCISWINICDGIVQCINGTDEEHCWQLEINECNEDEFRCLNGQCIPSSFYQDNKDAPDCIDAYDEHNQVLRRFSSNLVGPVFKSEEISCLKSADTGILPHLTHIYGCSNFYFTDTSALIYFAAKPTEMSNHCWSALNCYLKLMYKLDYFNCTDICQNETCKEIIAIDCCEIFFIPNVPIAYGHIYFAYTKEYIINQATMFNAPEYICYNEQLCGGFYTNRTLISFNNTTCRRPHDFPLNFSTFNTMELLHLWVEVVQDLLYHCNTIFRHDSKFCDNSTMYQCINSSKCIAQIRLFDGRADCDYGDDETSNLTDNTCPIKSSRMYVNCTSENRCLSRKIMDDGVCNCKPITNISCEDEPLAHSYATHIYFQEMCNNISRLSPISINGQKESDETECEYWPCNNIYTHCDGIFNCWNGDDELDCHPPSLINCSIHSYVCFSPKTYDYTCLFANQINDGNIDCVGGMDETNLCPRTPFSGVFFCNIQSETMCLFPTLLCDNHTKCLNGEDEKICHHIENSNLFRDTCSISNNDHLIRSDIEAYLCNQLKYIQDSTIAYFSLGTMRTRNKHIKKHKMNMALASSTTNQIISPNEHYCYHHPQLRVWLNKDHNETRMTCLCPPSHYGSQCQYQNERVSLTIQFRAFSDSWQTPFIIIVSLIDENDERIVHSHEQLTYLPIQNCKTKYNIDLLYSVRPKNQSQQYSIHIDIYEKIKPLYRGSLLIPLCFPFMPVERVAVQLNIPHTSYSLTNCSDAQCINGRCIRYFNDSKNSTFCQCNSGWSGRHCTIPCNCTACSSDSLCIGKLTNNRSICVCPLHKWGSRCFLHDKICQSKVTCQNDGQCIPTDRYLASDKPFICICQKGFSGKDVKYNKIVLFYHLNEIFPRL